MKHINAAVSIEIVPIFVKICILWVEMAQHTIC